MSEVENETPSNANEEIKVETFNNIALGGKSVGRSGTLKVGAQGMGWKSRNGTRETLAKADMRGAFWIRTGKTFQLKLELRNGGAIKFDGFNDSDEGTVTKMLKDFFSIDIQHASITTKGLNYGGIELKGSNLLFNVEGLQAFELPLADVSQAQVAKGELLLEFHQDDTSTSGTNEVLTEMRFHVPDTEDYDDSEADEEKLTTAQKFHKEILQKADIVSTGKEIVFLDQMPMLTPRGRYDIEMFPSFMKLHGKSYEYKVLYKSISRLFRLPKPDGRHVLFIISLDPAIRQGQTMYPHIVIQFSTEETVELALNLTEEELKEKYEGKLKPEISGETSNVVSKLFKILTGKKITVPGGFKSAEGLSAVRSSMKANEGLLFPLERSLFFVHKPPTYIRFEDIAAVEFTRLAGAGSSVRTFDAVIHLKSSGDIQFTNILRSEYSNLYNFLSSKKLKIINIEGEGFEEQSIQALPVDDDSSDEDDEDFAENQASGDESSVEEEDESSEEEEAPKPSKKRKRSSSDGDSKHKHKKRKKEKSSKKEKKHKKSKKSKKDS